MVPKLRRLFLPSSCCSSVFIAVRRRLYRLAMTILHAENTTDEDVSQGGDRLSPGEVTSIADPPAPTTAAGALQALLPSARCASSAGADASSAQHHLPVDQLGPDILSDWSDIRKHLLRKMRRQRLAVGMKVLAFGCPDWDPSDMHACYEVRIFDLFEWFYHAYENYMTYAFPHDELKPITNSYTDSLSELGNLKLEHLPENYKGSALTLIESLSSLLVMGNKSEFERGVLWLSENLTFDIDARINLFECNIRVLGGLVSAHILATDSKSRLAPGTYKNQLLSHAADLGQRFLCAFDTPTGLPYAWINLKYGVMENETSETSTSGCGSLILEMGALSRLTGDSRYETAALRALKYHEADMRTGKATYWQLTSLQAFWPGLQVLVGDITAANSSHREFFHIWDRFGVLPERYLLDHDALHPTEKYYPLRPEFAESTFYLYQATKG
ncbi:hypothetical protein J5N97_005060 [Dioscorea zingiberensis]|uniref:alpha-1,2-Mannosidase n=1 Tax=Dioscorea zingiberensis TaxID=325984 RepID=A0A9D5HS14_9LILI|nr:hypothetical protein J5N97_005060 [Dioscorea zingiberensis]